MGTVRKVFKDLYGRFVKRKAQEFNVENRAHKFLDQTKLPNAPGHQNEGQILEKVLKANPHLKEDVDKKHEKLVDNMGQVEIKVTHPPEPKTSKKKMPQDRTIIPKNTNFKVNNIPAGCIDFEIFLRIYDYKYNHLWTNEEIADEFDLDEKNVDDLLFFFRPFNNKIMDKKIYLARQDPVTDKTYVKIAELLNRDVETFKEIPDYKKELVRIEEENKKNQVQEKTAEDEIYEESEEEYLDRVNSREFMNERFFIAGQTDKDDDVKNDKKETSKDEKKKKTKDEVKNEVKNDEVKNDVKNDEVKNEVKNDDVKKGSNDNGDKNTETVGVKDSKKKTKNGSKNGKDKKDDSKEVKDDKDEKKTKTKKKSSKKSSSKNGQDKNGLEKDKM